MKSIQIRTMSILLLLFLLSISVKTPPVSGENLQQELQSALNRNEKSFAASHKKAQE